MRTIPSCCTIMILVAAPGLVRAQDSGGWRRVGEAPRSQAPEANPPAEAPSDSEYIVPAQLTLRPGTFVTVRVDQALSSDRNQPGDGFAATLLKPVVVDGVLVAQRGQTAGGRVVEAQKAGRTTGVSRLKIQLTDLTLVDGQPVPIQSELVSLNGPTSQGRDAGVIAGTTATGAAIGAAAGWGTGAAIGAGAGAVAGVVGVLLTRGHAAVIYPESVLTFRISAPASFSTRRAPEAFRRIDPSEYEQQPYNARLQSRPPAPGAPGPPPPPPYYYGTPYYPYYYGPAVSVFYGPGFYWGPRFYYGGVFFRGRRW